MLDDPSEGVISTCRVVVLTIETNHVVETFRHVFRTHRVRIEESSLNRQ
jgi:hypothetical protein